MRELCWLCGKDWDGCTIQIDDKKTCNTYNLCSDCIEHFKKELK